MEKSGVAIVGYGCRLPGANDPDTFWSVLEDGRCVIGEVQDDRWAKNRFGHPNPQAPGKSYTWRAGQIADPWGFDPTFFGISPREAIQIDPQQRILLQVAWEALEHAGIPASHLAGSETGVFVGAASVDHSYRFYSDPAATDIQFMTGNTLSVISNRLSYIFDLKGPSFTVDTACSSSIVALHEALEAIRVGRINTAIVAGVSMLLSPFAFVGFSRASMLSPTGLCRAFDADGDGYVRSEGAIVFILKALDDAIADGDRIQSVILGSGVNSDGRTVGLSLPSSKQQAALLRHVYDTFEVDPDSLAYLEAHGTGTRVGDPAEAEALGEVLGRRRKERLPIGSVKTNIGHLEAASGFAGLLKAQLILERKRIPASLHFRTPNPDIDFAGLNIEVVSQCRPLAETQAPRAIGVNSFGFGGTNAHVVLREPAIDEIVRPVLPEAPVPLVLSAQTPDALKVLARTYRDRIAGADRQEVSRLTNAAAFRRDRLDHLLIAFGDNADDFAAAIDGYLTDARDDRHVAGRTVARNAPVVFAFSGNGSQWAGMGVAAYRSNPIFRDSFDKVSALFQEIASWSLSEQLLSPDLQSVIDHTDTAQPLLFAVQVAVVEALKARGLGPDMVLGHSVGEVAAAWTAGILSLRDAVYLIHIRSTRQEATRGLGSMAALQVGAADARKLFALPAFKSLTLAADNSPRSVTVSGPTDALADFPAAARKHRLAARSLDLPYPFHSDLIEAIHAPLIGDLAGLEPSAEQLPFYSTVHGRLIQGKYLDAEYWWLNVRNPVLFRQAVEAAATAGGRVFVEIGGRPTLKNYLIDTIAGIDRTGVVVTSLDRHDNEHGDLFGLIVARAMAGGARCDDEAFFGKPVATAEGLPTYPWRNQPFRVSLTTEAADIVGNGPDHPLLGHRWRGGAGPWTAHVDTRLVPWLADHVVDGCVVMPAAGFLEMALQAARRHLGVEAIEIRDLDIIRPLVLEDGDTVELRTEIDASSDLLDISSRRRLADPGFGLHVRARVGKPPVADRPSIELPAATGRSTGSDDLYAMTHRFGLAYGPAFRRALSVTPVGAKSLVVTLGPDATGLVRDVEAVLHPTLIDAAFHGLFMLIGEAGGADDRAFLPIRVDDMRVYEAGATPSRVLIEITRASSRSVEADFTLTDEAGAVVARLTGVRFKAMQMGRDIGPTEFAYLTKAIRVAGRDDASGCPDAWQDAAARFGELGVAGAQAPEPDEATLLVDACCRAVVCESLIELSKGTGRIELLGGAPVGMAASALPLYRRAVDALIEDGAATEDDSGVTLVVPSPYPEASVLIATLVAGHPDSIAEAAALVRLSDRLGARLEGGLADAFPAALVEHLQTSASSAAARIEAAAVIGRDLVRQWPSDRPLRILLSGPGSLTLGRILADMRTIAGIVTTDPDPGRFERLALKGGAGGGPKVVPFTELQTYCEAHGRFDLAIVVDALGHPQANDTTAQLGRLLAPDAPMVVVESEPSLLADLVFGGARSWWQNSLLPDFPVSSLRTAEGYAGLLAEARFTAVIGRPLDSTRSNATVIFARAPRSSLAAKSPEAGPVVILTDRGSAIPALAEALAAKLATEGREVRLAFARVMADGRYVIEGLGESAADDVVFVPEANDVAGEMPTESLGRTLMIVHAVVNGAMKPARFWLAVPGATSIRPVACGLWGFGRVIANEYPDIETRLVDHDPSLSCADAADRLAALLASPPVERELVIDDKGLLALRHRGDLMLADHAAVALADCKVAKTLTMDRQGSLDGLVWRTARRIEPTDDQVEIEVIAAGLNFRDIMWALGLLPEEALEDGFAGTTLGMECSGRVIRVGPKAKRFRPGDSVIAFAPACFSTHVVVAEKALAPLPSTVAPEAAATIPVTFLTAYYSLVELARIEEGDTVLIHGGAGGVGLAALQIALSRGARAIATAGSAEKRKLLACLGAHVVLDSRSLAFADEVLAATDGDGVDIVLNSLSGEAMERSIECLKPFGRFVELGKRDYYANTRIALRPFRQNLSYFGVDADQLLTRRPALTERLFRELVAEFEASTFTALPYRVFAAEDITDAFRLMQAAGHIGKILIRPPEIQVAQAAMPIAIRADATYLIAGGLGGFGAETALFLARRGARHLVLTSRSGVPAEHADGAIASARAFGAIVETVSADLTDEPSMAALLDRIDATMPPLRGILHTAMVLDDALFANLDATRIGRVLAPKVTGAAILDRLTRSRQLDFFVLYSSATTLIGNPGQANYVAANAYLEGLARKRRAEGLPAMAIAWGAIADAGYLARDAKTSAVLSTRLGKQSLTVQEALVGLGLLFDEGASEPVIAYGRIDWAAAARELPLMSTPLTDDVARSADADGLESAESGELLSLIEGMDHASAVRKVGELLAADLSRILRLPADEIRPDRPLTELGMDSLMAVEMRIASEQRLGVEIPILSLANGATISEIARRIVDKAFGQDQPVMSDAVGLAVSQHLSGEPDADVTALASAIEISSQSVKRLL